MTDLPPLPEPMRLQGWVTAYVYAQLREYGAACAAAYKADAERYRWLKVHGMSENDDGERSIHFWSGFEHYDDLDAAIDAARGTE